MVSDRKRKSEKDKIIAIHFAARVAGQCSGALL